MQDVVEAGRVCYRALQRMVTAGGKCTVEASRYRLAEISLRKQLNYRLQVVAKILNSRQVVPQQQP